MATKKKNSDLVQIIKDDTRLTEEEKAEFISMASLYQADFVANLTKSSVDLADETDIPISMWRKFLTLPTIKRYLESVINEQIKKQADSSLLKGTGTRDAISVRKAMQQAESAEDNTKYILIRLPEKTDNLDEHN